MSRSSAEAATPSSRASLRRGQVEPLAALAAVFAVTVALGLYAGALQSASPPVAEPDPAPPALDAVAGAASDATGVLDPGRLAPALGAAPDDRRVNATLTADGRQWRVGPPTPATVSGRAGRRVAVATAPNRTAVGRLRVIVW